MTYLKIPQQRHIMPHSMGMPTMAGEGTKGEALRLMPASRVEPDSVDVEIDWDDTPNQTILPPPAPKPNNRNLLVGGGILAAAGLVAAIALID